MLNYDSNGKLTMTQIKFPLREDDYDKIIEPLPQNDKINSEFFTNIISNTSNSKSNNICSICNKSPKDCLTHLVGMRLPFYFINPSFSATLIKILNNICITYSSNPGFFVGCCHKLRDKQATSCKHCTNSLNREFFGASKLASMVKKSSSYKCVKNYADFTVLTIQYGESADTYIDITALFEFDKKIDSNELIKQNFENSLRSLNINPSIRLGDFVFDIVHIPPPSMIPHTQTNDSNATYFRLYQTLKELNFNTLPDKASKKDLIKLEKLIKAPHENEFTNFNIELNNYRLHDQINLNIFRNYYEAPYSDVISNLNNLPMHLDKFKTVFLGITGENDDNRNLLSIILCLNTDVISNYITYSHDTNIRQFVEAIVYILFKCIYSQCDYSNTMYKFAIALLQNIYQEDYFYINESNCNYMCNFILDENNNLSMNIVPVAEFGNGVSVITKLSCKLLHTAVKFYLKDVNGDSSIALSSKHEDVNMKNAKHLLCQNIEKIVKELLIIMPPIIAKDDNNTTLFMQLPNKKGIYRESLIAKQTTNCARTVVGPSETYFGNFEIPMYYSSLIMLVFVNTLTIKIVKDLAKYGFIKYIMKSGESAYTKYNEKIKIEIGDKVYRSLLPGDPVIMNRQPTLHAHSVLAHFIKYIMDPVVRLHPMCTKGYAADFDGDEMNTFISMLIESQLELIMFLHCAHKIISGNKPIIGPMFHELTVLSHMSLIADKEIEDVYFIHFIKILYQFDYEDEILKKLQHYNTLLNTFGTPEKNTKTNCKVIYTKYTKGKELTEEIKNEIVNNKTRNSFRKLLSLLFPLDFTYKSDIRDGIFVGKKLSDKNISIGNGHIIHQIHNKYGYKYCARMLNNITLISAAFMRNNFLSMTLDYFGLGVNQVNYEAIKKSTRITKRKIAILQNQQDKEKSKIKKADLESTIKNVGAYPYKRAELEFEKINQDPYDAFLIFILSGARGNYKSLQQITMSLGQQFNGNQRVNATSLPHIKKSADVALKHGYIYGNFNDGMSPEETLIHSVVVRDSIIRGKMEVKYVGDMANCIASCLGQCILNQDLSMRINDTVASHTIGGLLDPSKLINVTLKNNEEISTFIDIDKEF